MYREDSLGMNVMFEEEDPDSIGKLAGALRIIEDPKSFTHCMCLGEPTLEFFDDDELIATIAIHHGRSIRWPAWKHDAVLEDPRLLTSWMANRGIEAGDGPRNPEDLMMMGTFLAEAREPTRREGGGTDRRLGSPQRAARRARPRKRPIGELSVLPSLRGRGVLSLLDRFEEGREFAEESLRRGHRDANVLKTLAACLDGLGRSEEGLARCDEAIALEPDHPMARNSRGLHPAKAQADMTRARDRIRSTGGTPRLGLDCFRSFTWRCSNMRGATWLSPSNR